MTANEVKVWDPLVRVFHWTLVAAFAIAYATEDDLMLVHAYAGYTILGLLAVRIIWGLIGTRHARFVDFVYSPSTAVSYLKDVVTFKAKRYLGHNPAGGWMIIILMACLLATSMSGLVVYATEEHAGPLVNYVHGLPHWLAEVFEELHEGLANFTLFLVFVHVAGVVIESILHQENLVLSMWNGKKANRG
ncbi:MAG: cytochrome b/b6 domain-containing protein [Gammaproteobacteria bacterium]|nr:cytochrome b/b6 domain-containing protein [Gammaproteobacteria bacterium]